MLSFYSSPYHHGLSIIKDQLPTRLPTKYQIRFVTGFSYATFAHDDRETPRKCRGMACKLHSSRQRPELECPAMHFFV